jgi:hypothetical protein
MIVFWGVELEKYRAMIKTFERQTLVGGVAEVVECLPSKL